MAAASIFSCTKSETKPPVVQQPPVESRTIATDWMTMSFTSVTGDDGTNFLQANQRLQAVSGSDLNNHHEFVYAKTQSGDVISYQLLPFNITSDNENFAITHNLTGDLLSITIQNQNAPDQSITSDRFDHMQFQVILVSQEDYESLQVDWTDYHAVIHALRLLPLAKIKLESDR